MEQKKNSPRGIVFLVTAAVVWGFAFVAQRLGADHLGPFFFNGSRFLIGTLSLLPVILIFEKNSNDPAIKKKTLIVGIIAGSLLFFASYLQQLGIQMTDSAGKAGFITGLYMILVPIIGVFMRKKTSAQTWVGALLGVLGLFLICNTGDSLTFTAGDAVLVGCAVVFAFHIIVVDRFGDNLYSLRFSMTQFATATVLNLICVLLFKDPSLSALGEAAIPILYCGVMSTGVAYTCQILGQKYSEPTSASIILSTESVFSAIGGALILGERMSIPAYIGCVLIFCGIILSQVKIKKKNK